MYSNDRRHSCGTFKPNLFCMLQSTILLIVLYNIFKIVDAMGLGIHILLIASLLSIGAVFYILFQRKRVLERQNHCS